MASELIAIALLGCAAPPPPVAAPAPPAPSVKIPTFRWVATGNGCADEPETCLVAVPGRDEGPFVVAVYPPPADDPRVALVAYEGDHAGGRRKWQTMIDLGAAEMPAMALGGDRVVVAAANGGAVVRLAVVDTTDGVLEGKKAIEWPAVNVQLRDDEGFIDVFALDRDGTGHIGVFDPRTLELIATATIPPNATRLTASLLATAGTTKARLGDATFELAADGNREMLHRVGGWTSQVSAYSSMFAGITLYAATARSGLPDRAAPPNGGGELIDLLVVVAEPREEATTVLAFDAQHGHLQWTHEFARLRGDFVRRRVHSFLDAGMLVVQLADSDGLISCALALTDGHEIACITGILN